MDRFVLKIAYVLNTYPQPSHSFIRREIQALERQGAVVSRVAMRASASELIDAGDQLEAGKTHYVLQQGGVRLLRDLLWCLRHDGWAVWRALRLALNLGRGAEVGRLRHLIYLAEAAHLRRHCEAGQITHLHAHFGTNSTMVALLTHALGGPGYSFTTHGPEEFDAPRALSLGRKVDAARFAVAISSFGKSQLSRWASFGAWDHIHQVHCAIEPEKFNEPQPLPTGPLRLVAIGRFVEQKGQMLLIRALEQARANCPNVHLTLIGDGEMRPDLEAAVQVAGLQENVTFTGWLDEAGVVAQLGQAHCLVMPSFAEGLPMVIMEAMAAARPVLATYIAGTPELVQEGKTGWLVPAGGTDELAEAICRVAETDHARLADMGQAGRARVFERHNSDTEAAKLLDLFTRYS